MSLALEVVGRGVESVVDAGVAEVYFQVLVLGL